MDEWLQARTPKMKDYIGTEETVHGEHWGGVHGGYFGDPSIALPLVETVKGILNKAPADVVVDLGGGTGFLLSQLAAGGVDAALVNVDCSETQLAIATQKAISTVCKPLGEFKRGDIAAGDKRVLFMMRSVLHYLGKEGLSPLLRHIRSQARKGEYYVHQTASFDSSEDADCLNTLYGLMRTTKWYPTVADMKECLADTGWQVATVKPAAALQMTSDELALRYALNAGDIARICDSMQRSFGETQDLFRPTPTGFMAFLPYRIYACVAAI